MEKCLNTDLMGDYSKAGLVKHIICAIFYVSLFNHDKLVVLHCYLQNADTYLLEIVFAVRQEKMLIEKGKRKRFCPCL